MISGSIVALVTPMQEDGSVDYETLHRLIEWHVEEGTDAIVSVGTTGESATLGQEEHCQVIRRTIEFANKRIPVIAGTGARRNKRGSSPDKARCRDGNRRLPAGHSILQQTDPGRTLPSLHDCC